MQGSRICSNEKGYIFHELKHIIKVVSRLHFVSGLLWSSGSMWKEQRTFALTTMRKLGFGKRCLQGQIMEEVDCLMEELEKYGNKPFDIQNILNTSVSNVICSLLFGKRFDGNNVRDFIDGFLLEQKQAEENTTFTGNF